MYNGWLRLGSVEIINNHRTYDYAKNAGLHWLQACSECGGVTADLGGPWESPFRDYVKPPWYSATVKDSHQFYGLFGMEISGADDDTRSIPLLDYNSDGGTFGRGRRGIRQMVVKAVAVAASDCALQYGLSWLRGVDAATSCTASTMTLYSCCPCVCPSDCGSRPCLDACVRSQRREYRRSRIISGPTVLSVRHFPAGSMASVEFVVAAADPNIYTVGQKMYSAEPAQGSLYVPPPTKAATGGMLLSVPQAAPLMSVVEPYTLPSTWSRAEFPIAQETGDAYMAPRVALEVEVHAPEAIPVLNLTLEEGGEVLASMMLTDLRAGEDVAVDMMGQTILRRSSQTSTLSVDLSMAVTLEGGPPMWPGELKSTDRVLYVDQPVGTAPVLVTVQTALYGAA